MKRFRWKQYRIFIVLIVIGVLFALNNTATFGQGGTPVPPKLNPADHPDPVIPAAVARPEVSSSSPAANASVSQLPDQMGVTPVSTKAGNTGPLIVSPVDARRSNHFISLIAAYSTVVDPWIMTTDSSGNIFVADINLQVVKKLSPSGTLIQTYGTSGVTGTGPGLFNDPSGIALVGTDVFIGDYLNSRIQRFNISTGAFVSQFGSAGSGANQLSLPAQMAYDPFNGFLYVAELGNNRVHIFNTAGVSQGTFGIFGTAPGQFTQPFGLVIDPLGYLYVGEYGGNRVQKFTTNGTYIRTVGSAGTGDGQFNAPQGIAMDRAGFLYVADRGNLRIQKFDWKGGYVGQYGTSGPSCSISFINCRGFFSAPVGIAVSNVANAQPILYVADFGNSTLQAFETSLQPITHPFEAKWGSAGSAAGQFGSPFGIAVDSLGNVYVSDHDNNRVQKFDKYGTFIRQWGVLGNGVGEFNIPFGIAINAANNVFVVDKFNNRVEEFDSNGTFIRQWGGAGTGNGLFNTPYGIAVDNTYVYVVDGFNNLIQKFNFSGAFISQWGGTGTGDGQFQTPIGVAVDLNRQFVYVVEFGGSRVQIFTTLGEFVSQVPASTTGPGALSAPIGIATDQRGNVYVTDRNNNRVVQFSDNGEYIGAFGGTGSGNGQFDGPNAIVVDHNSGQIFTVEWNANQRVQRFGSTVPKNDTVGVWRPSTRSFYMRNSNTTGVADISVDTSAFTTTTDQPIVGDWNGDGVSTVGIYRNGLFLLRDSNIAGGADYSFALGVAGDVPIVGDWNGDGKDGVGVFRPSNGLIFIKNDLTTGFADYQMVLGSPGDIGLGGDWNADGQDSAGVRRPSTIFFYLANKVDNGSIFAEYGLQLGATTDVPFTGDWVHQGSSGVGVFRPSNGLIFLKNALAPGFADTQITLGIANDVPVGGYWGKVPQEAIPPMPPPAGEPASQLTPKVAPTFVP